MIRAHALGSLRQGDGSSCAFRHNSCIFSVSLDARPHHYRVGPFALASLPSAGEVVLAKSAQDAEVRDADRPNDDGLSSLVVYAWNIEHERELEDIQEDIGVWDVILL